MRSVPEDESDRQELARLQAQPWMVECLSLNPNYACWGPGEDYMSTESRGWDAAQVIGTWTEFGPWRLDDLNEVVNFYFQVERASERCEACDGSGLNPETHKISEDFYDFERTGRRWCDKITQDEVQALVDAGRLWDFTRKNPGVVPTDDEVNAWERERGLGHDAINRWILIRARATRLGVYGNCTTCEGHGHVFTGPEAKLGLVLWFLHPRKGCSRGVEVKEISREELPAVLAYLKAAADRNADRFAAVVRLAEATASK